MACIKKNTGVIQVGLLPGEYSTEQECLENCKMGACCLGLKCAVVPACACAKAGGHFFGPGTTCGRGTPNNHFKLYNDIACCYQLAQGCSSGRPTRVAITINDTVGLKVRGECIGNVSGTYLMTLQDDSSWQFIPDCGLYIGNNVVTVPCMPPLNPYAPAGVMPFVATAVFSVVNAQPRWYAAIQTTDGFTPDGEGTFVTGNGGPPCSTATEWSPASGCYSGTSSLYKYVGYSSSCQSRYIYAGTISVTAA